MQADRQNIAVLVFVAFKYRMAKVLEYYRNFRRPALQLFTSANIKRHTRPPPICNFAFHRDKAFGETARVFSVSPVIGRVRAGIILAAHNMVRLDRLQGADHFQLFIAHRVCVKMAGRFHRDQAQQLHQVVLDHIAHRAGFVIIRAAPANPHGFGHSDLDMIDVVVVPQRLEQHIGKADRHQVLHGFLAQIVINPVNLGFGKIGGKGLIQRAGGVQIAAKRFFHHDARRCVGNSVLMQPFGKRAKQRWGH